MKTPVYCSLIPAELLIHMGLEPVYLLPEEITSVRAGEYHCSFHENLCSYSKVLYDYFLQNHEKFGFIVVPTSCDAMKKLFNALKIKIPSEKLFQLDVPKIKSEAAAEFLVGEFERLQSFILPLCKGELEGVDHCLPSPALPYKGRELEKNTPSPLRGEGRGEGGESIAILGSNVSLKTFEPAAKKFDMELVYLNHCLMKSYPDPDLQQILENKGTAAYAKAFLENVSCPRQSDEEYRKRIKERIKELGAKGLVVNALKFCDFHPFDYKYFKKELDIPVMQIEHELTSSSEGQTMTRLEAFFENITKRKPSTAKKGAGGKYFVGIDSGSHATKLVCVDADQNIVARIVVDTGTSVADSGTKLLDELLKELKIKKGDIARIVATGYGRNMIKGADDVVTEISCHARGAHYILKKEGTIIDIGGQDSKAIRIDADGGVVRFAMNDKCAAGTGRFLEVMAAKLKMTLEEFAELASKSAKSVPISSMCSVFAESEVISLIAGGSTKEEIAKGIHKSIAERTIALARRIDSHPPYFMAGGVAKNKGLVKELEECLGHKLQVIENPQFSGALGAALLASEA